MRPLSRFIQLPWRSRTSIAHDVDTELSFHLEMRVNELRAHGMDADAARNRAREEFGDLEFTRAYCRRVDEAAERETRTADRVAEWRQDIRFAFRTLRRSPGFAAVSLITLALAIGANTAIFTVARAVLLEPLPYGAPSSLVALFESWPAMPGETMPMSPPNYVDYRTRQHSFTDVGAFVGSGEVAWRSEAGDPEMLWSVSVTPNLFTVLQTPPVYGRTFAPGDGAAGNTNLAMISYALWQRALGGDRSAIGKQIMLNGRPYQLIGVMPPRFTIGLNEDVWTPDDFHDDLANAAITRKQHYVHVVARLKPGVSIASGSADLAGVAKQLEHEYPEANSGRSAMIKPLRDWMVGKLGPAVLMLQGAAAMVLLIACANLANLTLSRTLSRRREMALRAALGAGRARLVRQLLTESVLLSLLGGVFGVALAAFATRALLALNPDTLPAVFAAGVDWKVILFSVGLSAATGVLFGLLPALDAARADLNDSLKVGARGASGGHGRERVRRALMAAQVGLAMMLLIGAGLLLRSFGELTSIRVGFDPDHVLTARIRAAGPRYDSTSAVNAFYDGILGEIAQAPGVVAVGAARSVPTQGHVNSSIRVDGEPIDEKNLPDLGYVSIRGDFFKALQIPLLAGRLYDATDLPDGPKTGVINQAAAKRFFPRGDAVGRRIRIGPNPNGAWITIVGVVGDMRDEGLDLPAKPTLFANHRQEAWDRSMVVFVRTTGDPVSAAPVVRRVLKSADPTLAARDVQTLNSVVGASLASRRFALGLVAAFAAVALALAAIGIYGVLAYMVTTRTREFGVRIALGASRRSVLLLVARHGITWSLAGMALGIAGAIAGGRLVAKMLYGVTPLDPMTYVGVAGVLLAVVVAACLIPASRATRVDPLMSMRAE